MMIWIDWMHELAVLLTDVFGILHFTSEVIQAAKEGSHEVMDAEENAHEA